MGLQSGDRVFVRRIDTAEEEEKEEVRSTGECKSEELEGERCLTFLSG